MKKTFITTMPDQIGAFLRASECFAALGVNIHGMTREQAEYNRYAPVLMTSVDTDPSLCAAERAAILQRLGAGEWKIFGAHGGMKEYRLREE